MKKPRTALLFSLLVSIISLLFFAGCSDMIQQLGNISLTIVLDTPDVEVSSYNLEAVHTNSTSRIILHNIAPPRHALSELKSGTWSITVTASDADGVPLGIGTQSIDLKEGQIVEKTLLVVFNQPAPESSTFTPSAPTRFDSADGQLRGTTAAMEYKLDSTPEEEPYRACTEGTTILTAGTYLVRYAAAHGLNPSKPRTVTIPNYQPIQLTITSPTLTATDRIYDGTTVVNGTVTAGALVGIQGTDDVTVSAQASYDSVEAGANKPITVTYTISGPDAENYIKPTDDSSFTGNITKKQLTVSGTGITANKVYDGSNTAQINSSGTLSGIVPGDSVTFESSAAYADKSAAAGKTITISYTLSGADAGNYIKPSDDSSNSGNITKKQITISGTTITANKEYDGTTMVTVTSVGTSSGIVTGDTLTVSAVAAYADNSVGSEKQITVSYSLSSVDAGNYIKPADDSTYRGNITKKQLTVSGSDLEVSKIYDGSVTASISTVNFTGKIETEDVSVSGSASYDSSTAGTGKQITVTYTLSGSDAGNYLRPMNKTVEGGAINKRLLSVSGTTITASKEYDGTNTAQVDSFGTLSDVVPGDSVIVSAAATYADKSAADAKTITVRYDIDGTDAGNYSKPADDITCRGNITKKQLMVSGTTITANKEYDGNNNVEIDSTGTLSGVVTGDSARLEASAAYADKSAASGKAITIRYALSGSDAGNYIKPSDDSSNSGNIIKKQLTVSQTTIASEKVYDGSRSATINSYGTLAGIITGDSVAIQTTATFDTKDVGTAKPITLTYTLSGTDKDNYFVPSNSVATETGVITRKQLNVSNLALTSNKVYDGTTSAETPTFSLVGTFSSDDVTVTATAAYDTPIAETGKRISITYSIDGDDKANYIKPADTSTTASCAILKKQLTISDPTFESVTKTYDGTTAVLGTVTLGSLSGVLEGDVVTVGASANHESANVTNATGHFNPITVVYTLDGTNASNYAPPVWSRSWGAIEPKQLSVIGTLFPASKVYDGTRTVPISSEGTLSGVIAGDSVSLDSVSAYYDTKDAGSDRAVAISYTISGTDTSNYYLNNDTSRKASITQAVLTATVEDYTQQYGAATPAFVVDITGFVGGESAGTDSLYSPPTATTGTTPTSAVGTYTISITGGNARNYSFDVGDTGTLIIEKAAGPPAPSEHIVGKFPSAATSIELTGFAASASGLEAAVAINGITYASYADVSVDADGGTTLAGLSGVTTATKVRVRVKETATVLVGSYREISVTEKTFAVGDIGPGGGYVFYDVEIGYDFSGDGTISNYERRFLSDARYLEAAPAGWNGTPEKPYVFGYFRTTSGGTNTVVGTRTEIGKGEANTTALVSAMGNIAYSSTTGTEKAMYAAKACFDYVGGGYTDWFLPSKDELNLMRQNLWASNPQLGGLRDASYWSSSENSGITAWQQMFYYGSKDFAYRYMEYWVRPVRAF